MARHVISVCVFCLICATHTPCASHVATRNSLRLIDFDTPYKERTKLPATIPGDTKHIREVDRLLAKRDTTAQNKTISSSNLVNSNNTNNDRNGDDIKNNELDMAQYMKKLFSTYGDGDTMTLDGFERMMHKLGLIQELTLKIDNNLLDEKNMDGNVTSTTDDRVNFHNSTVIIFLFVNHVYI